MTKCSICSNRCLTKKKSCDTYLFEFLIHLQDKLDDEKEIEKYFQDSIFDDEDQINQTSCNGLTLMHINVLGDQSESEQENKTFVAPYDESTALEICQILLKYGASANGNTIYEMRPLHIAIRREWLQVARVLLEAGANPNIAERDIYASRPVDIAVLNDDSASVELLHLHGASLNGMKSMFHMPPLTEAFIRGYFDVYKTLLELGARPMLDLERSIFRSFGTQLFELGAKGRRHFIQLLHDHGGDIEKQLKICALRIEPDGVKYLKPYLFFSCDAICIADLDPSIFVKWLSECRSLKALCRLALRHYLFTKFPNGYHRLLTFKSQTSLSSHLINYLLFNRHV